jgi:hypothetical protein
MKHQNVDSTYWLGYNLLTVDPKHITHSNLLQTPIFTHRKVPVFVMG